MTCALLLIFFVLVALSLLSSCGGDEVQEVLLKIQQLKVAANSQSDHAIKIDIRRRVAIGYFSLSLMHHVGGGKFQDDALSAFNEALAVTDNSAAAAVIQLNFFQGILLRTMGRPDESFSVLAAVISEYGSQMHLKDLSNYLCNQAEALVASNQLARARDRYQSAIATNPCHDSAYYGLVKVCRDLADLSKQQWQDLTSTIESLQKSCISQSLENVIGLIADLIGATTVLIGEGASLQTSAVAVDSFTTSTHLRNTNMFTTIDLSESNYRSMDSGSLYWTLFLCAEKISDFAKAWKFLELANAKELQQKSSEFNSALAIQQTQTLKSVFTKQFLTQRAKGSKSRVPIFVVGMMRSGSTLLESMLDSHPLIVGIGEDSVFNGNLIEFRDKLVAISSTGDSKKQLKQEKKLIHTYANRTIAEMYKYVNKSQSQTEVSTIKHVVDKMLFNYKNIGFIHMIFPNAAIVHIIRDPLDMLISCYRNKFDDRGLEWSFSIKHLVLVYKQYLEIMHHWQEVLPRNRIINIRYEKLVNNPKVEIEKILERLGVPFHEDMLDFYSNSRMVHTNSMTQVRKKLYFDSIGSWRRYYNQIVDVNGRNAGLVYELEQFLPKMLENGMLPFPYEINWKLDLEFAY